MKPREISPGVWQVRVYTGRGPNGSPIQIKRPETELGGVIRREPDHVDSDPAGGHGADRTRSFARDELGRVPEVVVERLQVRLERECERQHYRIRRIDVGHSSVYSGWHDNLDID